MSDAPLPSIQMLGFRKIATLHTRTDRNGAERIAYCGDSNPACQVLRKSTDPATYMWVVADLDRPVYVGKASGGIEKRAREHEGGFHETATERQKREGQDVVRPRRAGLAHAERFARSGRKRKCWSCGRTRPAASRYSRLRPAWSAWRKRS